MTDLRGKYGRYALITGASSGIGAEFAEQLAAAGLDLVLVARRKDRLEALAGRLRAVHGIGAEVIALDLAAEGAVAELVRRTEHLDVALVVASAGILTTGPFLGNDFAAEAELLRVNLMVPAEMAHVFGRHFAARGRGALILLSSVVGFGPVPYSANYGAVKGYIASLGQALHYELKGSGVDVLTLAPGLTQTEGADNAPGIDFGKMPGKAMPAGPVVRAALRGLGRKPLVIPGGGNKAQDFLGKYLTPRRAQTAMSGIIVSRALRDVPGPEEAEKTA
ncbi:MAG: SDR family NAD(P)-dependent oxidoreductase [Trebonia sp.]